MKKKISTIVKASIALTAASGISAGDVKASEQGSFNYLGSGKELRQTLMGNSKSAPYLGSKSEGQKEQKNAGEMKCGEGLCGDKMMQNDSSKAASQSSSNDSSVTDSQPDTDQEIDVDGSAAENPPADD